MNKCLLLVLCLLSLGLTPYEKKIVQQARTELGQARSDYDQALKAKDLALHAAADAEMQSSVTSQELDRLKGDISRSHDNEARLEGLRQRYEPFYIQGHKWWGLGAIFLGFGILAKHLLILIAILVALSLVIGIAYSLFTKTPIGAIFDAAWRFIRGLFKK